MLSIMSSKFKLNLQKLLGLIKLNNYTQKAFYFKIFHNAKAGLCLAFAPLAKPKKAI